MVSAGITALGPERTALLRFFAHSVPIAWSVSRAAMSRQFDGRSAIRIRSIVTAFGMRASIITYRARSGSSCTSISSMASDCDDAVYTRGTPFRCQRPPYMRAPSPENADLANRAVVSRQTISIRGLSEDAVFDASERVEHALGTDVSIQEAERCPSLQGRIRRLEPVEGRFGILEDLGGSNDDTSNPQEL